MILHGKRTVLMWEIYKVVSTTVFSALVGLHMNQVSPSEQTLKKTAIYSGEISKERNAVFLNQYKTQPPDKIIITSSGGEVAAAITLARWIYRYQIDVEIDQYCLSSCANYLFPAANRKIIQPGAIVAWHGNYHHLKKTGLWKSEINARMEKYKTDYRTAKMTIESQVDELVKMEHDFFNDIKVNQFICWVGKMPPYNVADFYFLSRQDMAHFGINKIVLNHDYATTDITAFPYDVIYLNLD